jgi:hypothetical protein
MQQLEELRLSVDGLSDDSKHIRAEMRRRTWVLGWLLAGGVVVLACAVLAAYTVSLNNQRDIAANNRKWCPMVGLLILKPGDPRPTTARGLRIVDSAQQLYTQFGCDQPN